MRRYTKGFNIGLYSFRTQRGDLVADNQALLNLWRLLQLAERQLMYCITAGDGKPNSSINDDGIAVFTPMGGRSNYSNMAAKTCYFQTV